jgi:hypothetical protein
VRAIAGVRDDIHQAAAPAAAGDPDVTSRTWWPKSVRVVSVDVSGIRTRRLAALSLRNRTCREFTVT